VSAPHRARQKLRFCCGAIPCRKGGGKDFGHFALLVGLTTKGGIVTRFAVVLFAVYDGEWIDITRYDTALGAELSQHNEKSMLSYAAGIAETRKLPGAPVRVSHEILQNPHKNLKIAQQKNLKTWQHPQRNIGS
jgi:hypothetical protein